MASRATVAPRRGLRPWIWPAGAWAWLVRALTGQAHEGLRQTDVTAYYRTTDG